MIVYQILVYDQYYPRAVNSVFSTTSLAKAEARLKVEKDNDFGWDYVTLHREFVEQ